ncbi:flagellar M-ring protein FliF, partial [Corallococcus sp. AB004]
ARGHHRPPAPPTPARPVVTPGSTRKLA